MNVSWWTRKILILGIAALLSVLSIRVHGTRAAADPAVAAHAADTNEGAEEAMRAIRGAALRADMGFLANDLLEGRGAATRGHEIAAQFMASQFEGMGLQPGGDRGSFFQQVPMRSARVDEAKTLVTLVRDGQEQTLTGRQDYIAAIDPGRKDVSVEAPVVFVGYGVSAPELGYDDYKGMDVKGKIAAFTSGAPPSFETSLRAHYSSDEVKLASAVERGVIGIIVLDDPVLESMYSFKEQVRDLATPQLRWLDPQGRPNDYAPAVQGGAFLSLDGVKKFFAGSGHSPEEIYAAAKAGKPKSFAMSLSVRIRTVTELHDVRSPNVVAKLPGSDPRLRDEYVVYTAHLDHLGIGEPVNGDAIYNGALDNASGSADLLEIARAFTQVHPAPRRSILFVAVTGEEAGLLGSDYFAQYPTVPRESMVANINMDEDLMLWPLEDLIVYGADHSSLGAVAEQAAKRLDLALSPDTQPEQVFFIRSDQYSFVKQGVPAIAASAGTKSSNPAINAQEIDKQWEDHTYHQPQDDMTQPFNFEAGAKYARFNFLCGYIVAQAEARPMWNAKDFFGEHYGPKSR
jgi:Zn-dependent M28 family amino/carboxypeptidase